MEDETGTASIMIRKKVYEAFREAVIAELFVGIISRIERDGPVVHVAAACVEDVSHVLAKQGRR
jgi:error-prone DNA polymerase